MSDLTASRSAATNSDIPETTAATFRTDILVASMKLPVLVTLWAHWCDPCRQLEQSLAAIIKSAEGKALLFRMNIDEHPQIAKQLGIQSIPAVIAFQKGQPADGFAGLLPEDQIRGFLERLVGPLDTSGESLSAAEAALAHGDAATALALCEAIAQNEPDNPRAVALYLRSLTLLGETERASAIFDHLPQAMRDETAMAPVITALTLARQAAGLGDTAALERAIDADPANYQARLDLALALNADGKRSEATDALLVIIKCDRSWNDDGARKQLLQFFELWGPMDPATKDARRKLSALLFA